MLGVYRDFAENVAAVPVYAGIRAPANVPRGGRDLLDRSADARRQSVAVGNLHDLGQNFAKAYDIKFLDADQQIKHAYTTSWGMSWRMFGAMIMVHGDDRGLRVPPKMAPIEAVFVPIVRSGDDRAVAACQDAAKALREAGFRVKVDDRDQQPGWKYAEWDLRGVPVRIEIGPRDVDAQTAVVVRRDRAKGDPEQKQSVALPGLAQELRVLLDAIQVSLFDQAKAFLTSHTFRVSDRDEFYEKCKTRAGMIDIPWCGRPECEQHIKEETGATTRNTYALPANEAGTKCVASGEPAVVRAYFAQSY